MTSKYEGKVPLDERRGVYGMNDIPPLTTSGCPVCEGKEIELEPVGEWWLKKLKKTAAWQERCMNKACNRIVNYGHFYVKNEWSS